VTGLEIVNASTTMSSSTNEDVLVDATATCPAGKVVIGGGGEIDTSTSNIRSQVVMFRSHPASTTTWRASSVILSGFSGESVTVTSYAICVDS
jgi:hypothetical protein